MPSLATVLIPLLPGLIQGIMDIVNSIKSHPATTQAEIDVMNAQLDTLSAALAASVAAVAAAPDVNAT